MADSDKKTHGAKPESSYWIARNSKSVIFLILTLAAVGLFVVFTIPVAVFPSTAFPRVIIGVDNGVMPIDQMMVTITRPLEEAVNSVQGLDSVQSVTSRGSAEIDLYFNWNVDMFQTLQRVDSAVARVQTALPSTAIIDTHRLSFASFPIIGYSLTSNNIPQTQLWELATYNIKPRLNRLNGVATVLVQGGAQPEFELTPDPSKLLRAHVTVPDILEAVRRTNLIDSPGLLDHNHQLFLGLITAQVHTPEEIGDIVIKNVNETPVRLRDLGTVAPSVAPAYTVVTANGKPAVLLSINRQPGSNTVAVADEVHSEIEQLRQALPPGVDLRAYYDQSTIVNESIKSVRDAIMVGLILASIILVVFLHDWGSSVVAGMVIPVTVLVTFIAMKVLGESFNLMTMGGLAAAVGLMIDDAIVVVENIVLHREAGENRLDAIHLALKELSVPLVGSTITPVVVFLPLISITGVTGTFFRALATTMSVSLFTSLALALVWTPTLSLYLLHGKKEPDRGAAGGEAAAGAETSAGDSEGAAPAQDDEIRRLMAAEEASMKGFFGSVIVFYERWVRRALEHPAWLAILCVLLVVVSFVCYISLGTGLLPAMDEGGFVLDYVMSPGASLQETDRVVSHMEQIVRSTPEVESTSRRTGLQLGLAAVTEANTGDISVKLKDERSRTIDEVISEIRGKIKTSEPSVDIDFPQVLQDMIGDLTGAPQPIQIMMFSPNADLLARWAPQVGDAISEIKIGNKNPVVDVADGIQNTTSGPAVVFQVNPATAARAGFTPEEIATDAAALLDGEPTPTPVIANDQLYTLRVRFPQANRASLDAMSNTMLISSTGSTATLGSLATVTELPGQTEITRINQQREVSVTARLAGVDLGTGIAAVKKAVADLGMPSSIRVEYGGTYKEQQKSFSDLVKVLVLALVLVFLVLLFEFRQFAAPVAILSSAVLSTSGVFFALLITGITFNISSFMGLIMVIGIVAKNGILLLDADHKFRHAGFAAEEAMIQAGRRRLRPIVMTALAAVAGMLPLALAFGAGSQMLQPLAIAVIGGILISMVLSLVVTPAIQYYMTRNEE
ncbi:MAG TPA: efflux RND transporter permease subunit [Terriglobia bacterium]|nr:efflux RND transporter permease subunit [Terriglobia bacterium]